MNKILMGCIVGLILVGGLWVSSYAQQTDKPESKKEADEKTQTKQGQVDNSWRELCRNMMATMVYPASSGSILDLKDYLNLSEEQVKKLNAIVEKANAESRNILTDEQRKKLESVSENWQPQSMQEMMSRWQKMDKQCGPMMQEKQEQRRWGCGMMQGR